VSALARRWAALGHRVTVLTTFPNHPTGVIPPEYRGHFRLEEVDDGVRVVRTYIYAAPNRGVLKRSLNYVSFAVSSVLQGHGPTGRPDLVLATSPQFLVSLAGWALSRLKGVPFVLEVRDLWPDSVVAVGALPRGSLVVGLLRALERFAYRHADLAVSVTNSFVGHMVRNGARRVVVIPNGADPSVFRPLDDRSEIKRRYGLEGKFVACFAGTLGMAHGLEVVLDAAELMRDDPNTAFWLVGEGARRAELEQQARRRGLANVVFQGQVPRGEVPAILAASDVALVLLRADPLFETVLPSKMFEAMSAGRPIVLGVGGEAKELMLGSEAGVAIPPGDAPALAAAIRSLRARPEDGEAMGRRGRAFVVANLSHDALASRYLEALQALLDTARR
jgi:glycosyltransferase involved in cell wall biosynthesis